MSYRHATKIQYRSSLEQALALAQTKKDVFVNKEPLFVPLGARGIFGGTLVAQALLAAYKTVPENFYPHSLQSYFLSAGKPGQDVEYRVERLRDGKNFLSRETRAHQNGKIIFIEVVSFTQDRKDLENQPKHYMQPRIDGLKQIDQFVSPAKLVEDKFLSKNKKPFQASRELIQNLFERYTHGVGEYRIRENYYDDVADPKHADFNKKPDEIDVDYFVKLRTPTTNRIFNFIAFAYFSDSLMLSTIWKFQKLKMFSPRLSVSLDHTIHFHRTPDMNNWIYTTLENPRSIHGRKLMDGYAYDPVEGDLVATIQQEGLVIVDDDDVKQKAKL